LDRQSLGRGEIVFAPAIVAVGLAIRLWLVSSAALNPDEASHTEVAFGNWSTVFVQSLQVTHPPLLILINHVVLWFARGEVALRLVPVLAGSIFPLVLAAWMRRIAGITAAGFVLVILSLSPALIRISATVRSYTLALLFVSLALLTLEAALEKNSYSKMALFSFWLVLAMLSDYSVAWFAAGAGAYALLRLRGMSRTVKTVWAIGQAIGFLIYLVLVKIQVLKISPEVKAGAVGGWLAAGYPHRENWVIFPFTNTPMQFTYIMSSRTLGVVLMGMALLGIYLLLHRGLPGDLSRGKAAVALFCVPFVLCIAAAYARVFPYAGTRHTLVLGTLGVLAAAIPVASLGRRTGRWLLCAAAAFSPLWFVHAPADRLEVPSPSESSALMRQAIDHLRTTIPEGATVFSDRQTWLVVDYYMGEQHTVPVPDARGYVEDDFGGRWRWHYAAYTYLSQAEFEAGLRAFRKQYGLAPGDPVWIVSGGWAQAWKDPGETRPFSRALQMFAVEDR